MRISDALLDDQGRIDAARWRSALHDGLPVGECDCGGRVLPEPADPAVSWGRTYHEAACAGCGAEVAVPATRVVRDPTSTVVPGLGQLIEAAAEVERRKLGERDDDLVPA